MEQFYQEAVFSVLFQRFFGWGKSYYWWFIYRWSFTHSLGRSFYWSLGLCDSQFVGQSVSKAVCKVVDSWFASLAVNTLIHNFKLVCCTVHYGLFHCDWNEVWTYCSGRETWWSLPNLSWDNHCRHYIQIYEYYVMKSSNCNHMATPCITKLACYLQIIYEVTIVNYLQYIKKIVIVVNIT